MCLSKSLTTGDPNDPIVNKINQQSKELLTKSSDTEIYINKDSYGIVWKNVIVFTILHLLTIHATIVLIRDRVWNTWIFAYLYGFLGGLGVTAGAHRLWSHRFNKAKFSLRLFLVCCFSITGQNDLLTWCRDHRVHHKFSETDSDPHNSRRGFFFAHVGWLLTRKHPSVIEDGKKVDLSDLMDDPIVRYHRSFFFLFLRFYPICYVVFIILIPWLVPVYLWSESISTSLLIAVIWRYVTSLHCTWFVNSTAHMWGDRPYRSTIGARENYFVSFAAFGEGFHNFHHSFPWDYATSELGSFVLLSHLNLFVVYISKFKTCEESGFCRRNRNIKGKPNKWVLDHTTVKPSDNKLGFEAILKNELNGVLLRLTINAALQDSSVLHVRVNEAHPGRERFDPREALVENIEYSKINIGTVSDKEVTLTFGPPDAGHKTIITFNPFRFDIFKGERLVVSANAREFLKFEHFRQKRVDIPEEEKPEEEKDGGWEENFKSFVDTKPYGPMSVGMDFSFVGFDHLYGLPEHADTFSLKNTRGTTDPFRFYNVDIFEYELNNGMALYGAIPFMMAHAADHTVGLLWLNPSETWVDIESSNQGVRGLFSHLVAGEVKSRLTHWFSETGLIDVWIMLGPSPLDVIRQNAKITGTLELPPYYAIGYHQCRWNYFSQEELNEVERQCDANDLPLDVLWLDIEYTEGRSKKYFTWDPVMFSDPKSLVSNLTSKGRQLVTIIDPHIKKDTNYPIYNEATQNNYFTKTKEGNDYEGYCWPGPALYPDFLNPTVREWWSSKFNPEFFPGFTDGNVGIWNDMNEPSVFNGPEMTAPRDVVHINGIEHRDIHNMYGFLVTKATHKGLITYSPNHRPFILTRSFFVGSQRYAMVWTGDNMAKWDHLKMSVPMILSLGISGMAFSGADAPGFFYDPESTELVVRWYQTAAFQPFYRAHAHLDTKHREPYLYDEETKNHIRAATRARYAYLPYIYTLFYEASINGTPIMRPLWLHFPKDTKTFDLEEEYLLGDALLIRPVLDKEVTSVNVYFPGEGESWLGIEDDTVYQGGSSVDIPVTLGSIPRFQRAGTIIPKRERMRRSCSLTLNDPLTLQIFLDAEERHAEGRLFLDDGSSYSYKSGGYILAEIVYDKMVLSYKIIHGSFPTNSWLERVIIHRISNKPNKIEATSGANLSFKFNPSSQTLIIRKPGLSMGDSWQIRLS